jgi:hypothetical protein
LAHDRYAGDPSIGGAYRVRDLDCSLVLVRPLGRSETAGITTAAGSDSHASVEHVTITTTGTGDRQVRGPEGRQRVTGSASLRAMACGGCLHHTRRAVAFIGAVDPRPCRRGASRPPSGLLKPFRQSSFRFRIHARQGARQIANRNYVVISKRLSGQPKTASPTRGKTTKRKTLMISM